MNIETFKKEVAKLNIKIDTKKLQLLEEYKNLLQEYNQKFNLTSIISDEDIYLKHFYDSLTLIKVIDLNKELKILDIGTGAGFPGLVLKIFFPQLEIVLLDSNNKKITFLNEVIKSLNLEKITCIHSRAEDLKSDYREYFDIVVSRAVASLRVLTELSIPYVKVGGFFIAMKAKIEGEVKESINTIKILNSNIIDTVTFNLPIENSTRSLLKIEKIAKTKKEYPRPYDKIVKKSLN